MNHSSHVVHKIIISRTREIALSLRLVCIYILITLNRSTIILMHGSAIAYRAKKLRRGEWTNNDTKIREFSSRSLCRDSVSLAVHKLAHWIPRKSQISLHFHGSLVSAIRGLRFSGSKATPPWPWFLGPS